MKELYSVTKIDENTYSIDEEGVRFFLLKGKDKALLIDSGMEVKNADEIAKSLTDLPIILLNTHADGDHTGSNMQFKTSLMHPDERENYYKHGQTWPEITPINEGDVIDLGDRKLEIIHLPGHTPGCIALYEREKKTLFTGDVIQDSLIFMFGSFRNMPDYIKSLEKLEERKEDFSVLYPSHGSIRLGNNKITKLLKYAKMIQKGEIEKEEFEIFGEKINKVHTDAADFLVD